MDAIVQTEERLLPALAEQLKLWFPEANGRAFAVSNVSITKENIPTLPLIIVGFARSSGDQSLRNHQDIFDIEDSFVIEFWLEPARYKNPNGTETPYWSYYPYDKIRDTLLSNMVRWQPPRGIHIAYRNLIITADPLAVTLTFGFVAAFRWCATPTEFGVPFEVGFNLCAPESCDPEEECEEEVDPCAPSK